MIYLDNAATTMKKPSAVSRAVITALGESGGAGRGTHAAAASAGETMFQCREAAAALFGVTDPEKVVFTMNATHALNIAIHSLSARRGDERCVISGYEHNSVYRPLVALEKRGLAIHVAKAQLFEPEMQVFAFEQALEKKTDFAVCTAVSNVFGYVLPFERIDELCYKKGVPLILDASQAAGAVKINLSKLKATQFVCLPGHKGLYGPQGTGLLLCKNGAKPLLYGGSGSDSLSPEMPDYLPDGLEAGTQNAHGIAGLLEGIRYVRRIGEDAILKHEKSLIADAVYALSGHPSIRPHTCENQFCQSGALSVSFVGGDPERAAEYLADRGICVRAGLHCAPLAHQTAGTHRLGTLRMSVSSFSTRREVYRFAAELKNYMAGVMRR
ncbi:aminotransferase class V-fold PLP-dependent enzyme [Oscillospiraceae bacterium OttesenSCG-928-G22]|nr:aminotransferase class V-fold PLP-dependent enzyme [Oscillospiraceae bacterium OttesenSCG-928-G22]